MRINSILNTQSTNNIKINQNYSCVSFKGAKIPSDSFNFGDIELPDIKTAEEKLLNSYFSDWELEMYTKNMDIYKKEILFNEIIQKGHDKFMRFLQKYLGKQARNLSEIKEDSWLKAQEGKPMCEILYALENIKAGGVEKLNGGPSGFINEMLSNPDSGIPNGVAIVTKDLKTGEDILDCVEFYSKLSGITRNVKTSACYLYDRIFKSDFLTCALKPGQQIGDLEEIMTNALEEAGEKYKKTGRKTILHIKDMQDLINPEIRTTSEIAQIKYFMQCTVDDYKTIYTLVMTDPEKLAYEAIQGHRIGLRLDLNNITREEVDELLKLKEETKEAVSELTRIYNSHAPEYHKLRLREFELHRKLSEKTKILQELYENPEENKAKILAIISEKPESPIELPKITKIKPESPIIQPPKEIPVREIKNVDSSKIENIAKSNKIGDIAKSNKIFFALAFVVALLAGAGIFKYLKNREITKKAVNKASPTLLKNINFNNFINKNKKK